VRPSSQGMRVPEERRVAELQMWAISRSASLLLVDAEPYAPCKVAGVVQRLRLDPAAGCIEATIGDGTGVIVATWPIRRPLPQLGAVPGTGLVLAGMPIVGDDGELVMVDPAFEIVPFPDPISHHE